MTASERHNYQSAVLFSIILHLSLMLIVFPIRLFTVPAGVEEVAVGIYEFTDSQPQVVTDDPEPELAAEPEKLRPKPIPSQPKPVVQIDPQPKKGEPNPTKPGKNTPKTSISLGSGAGMISGFGEAPYYPKNALNEEVEGEALVRVLIKIDGTLEQVDLIKSSGDSRLDRAAVNSLKRDWVFKPNTDNYYIDISFLFVVKSGVEYKLVKSAIRP